MDDWFVQRFNLLTSDCYAGSCRGDLSSSVWIQKAPVFMSVDHLDDTIQSKKGKLVSLFVVVAFEYRSSSAGGADDFGNRNWRMDVV